MRKNEVKFANFVGKFGDENLVDRLEDIVLPAFLDKDLERKRGSTRYLFSDVKLRDFGEDVGDWCIWGRFVKVIILRSEQRLVAGGDLVEDRRSLDTAPSSFFLLRLAGHRLVYFAETRNAPTMQEFETTARHRMRRIWERFIDREFSESEGVTKTSLIQRTKRPTVRVTPMSGTLEVEEFIARFSKINKLEIEVQPRNDEVDANDLAELIEGFRDDLGGDKGKLTVPASGDGLDASAVAEKLKDLGAAGNQSMTVSGKDEEGDVLKGNQEDFSVTDHISEPPNSDTGKADKLYELLLEKGQVGDVNLGNVETDLGVINPMLDDER